MRLTYDNRPYSFRSPGLLVFLRLLADAHPAWVDLAGIEARLPGIDRRQIARFIDTLAAADLPLVAYETKTRGRFRLTVAPALIAFPAEVPPPPRKSVDYTPRLAHP